VPLDTHVVLFSRADDEIPGLDQAGRAHPDRLNTLWPSTLIDKAPTTL
jgi:hypothetical protein